MHLDKTNNGEYTQIKPSILMSGLGLLSGPLRAALLLSLASCAVQPQ
jgi:hypothetical protein